jgi:Haem-binding domain
MPRLLLFLVAVVVLIQIVPIQRDNPPVSGRVPAPPAVMSILHRSCYDCHSNETIWPWYSRVAPASWLVAHDVHEGRRHLNFSEWKSPADTHQQEHLSNIPKEVESGHMPLWYYLVLHTDARLSADDVALLVKWAGASGAGGAPAGGQ